MYTNYPGTETQVPSVVTDAQLVQAALVHSKLQLLQLVLLDLNLNIITIKALEDAVVGAARAEGSFIIDSIPTTTSFTYFAKAKVGTTNGDVLPTTYTQLRQGAFYTGASVGQLFSVFSNGTNGTMVLSLSGTTK